MSAEIAFDGAVDHAPVVGDLGAREVPGGGLDAGPFDAEPVVGEAEFREQVHVLAPPVVAVGRVEAGLGDGAAAVFRLPPVAVDVVALDLVGGGGGSPQEPVGEAETVGGDVRGGHGWAFPEGSS